MTFAAVADGVTWLVRAIDNYQFEFYTLSDFYLPFIFLLGLALLLPSISIAFQSRRATRLAIFPLTTVGPLPPELLRRIGQLKLGEAATPREPPSLEEIPTPKLAFVPSPSRRIRFQRLGRISLLLAVLLYIVSALVWVKPDTSSPSDVVGAFVYANRQVSRTLDIAFYILAGLGFFLQLWPDVRETEELSLQGEPRAAYRGTVRSQRSLPLSNALPQPQSFLRRYSYLAILVLFTLWVIFVILAPLTRRGLMVHIPKPGTFARADERWNPPVVVRIDAMGNCYLNRQPVRLPDLGPRFEEALSGRADWTVYIDVDPDATYGYAVEVADLFIAAGGKRVVLVTPSMEKENPGLFAPPPCEMKAISTPELPLPPRGKRSGYFDSGVSMVVNPRGFVSKAQVIKSSGDAEIDHWAVQSVRKWKYTPTPARCGNRELQTALYTGFAYY